MRNPSSEPAIAAGAEPSATGQSVRLGLHFGAVLLVAALTGAQLGGVPMATSVALGVALAGANLLLMRRITSALTGGGGSAWLVLLPFKLIALVGIAYGLVAAKVAQPVPLAAGFALLPLTAVFLPRPRGLLSGTAPQRGATERRAQRSPVAPSRAPAPTFPAVPDNH